MKNLVFLAAAIFAAFFAIEAKAQSVVTNVSTNDFKACKEYLTAHPADTIRSMATVVATEKEVSKNSKIAVGDTLLCTTSVYKNAEGKVAKHSTFVKKIQKVEHREAMNFEAVAAIDRKAEETQLPVNLTKGRKANRKDIKGYKSDDVKAVYDDVRGNAGVVVEKAADKDGFSLEGEVNYQVASNCNAVGASAGVAYTGSFFQGYVNGGFTRSIYTEKAEKAGENYTAFKSEAALLVQPFKFDRFDQNRLFIGAGLGFEHYETNTEAWTTEEGDEFSLSSGGNYLYPLAVVKFEHRMFATGNSFYVKAQIRRQRFVLQNAPFRDKVAFSFSVGYNLGLLRHKINNTK